MGQQVQLSKVSRQHQLQAVDGFDESVHTLQCGKSSRGTFWSQNIEATATTKDSHRGVSVARPSVSLATTCPAAAAEVPDWSTTQGLALYLLSTLLLSVQATSAKLLGQCGTMATSRCHYFFTTPTTEIVAD